MGGCQGFFSDVCRLILAASFLSSLIYIHRCTKTGLKDAFLNSYGEIILTADLIYQDGIYMIYIYDLEVHVKTRNYSTYWENKSYFTGF